METPKGVDDLRLRFDGESRKEYECGCYHRRQKVVWSFFAVCPQHKAAVRAEWNARPWHKKLFAYAMFVFLLVLAAVGVNIVGFLIWKIVGGFF